MLTAKLVAELACRITAFGYHEQEARSIARTLVAHHNNNSYSQLMLHAADVGCVQDYQPWLQRLTLGEPLQYILGCTEFMGLNFACSPQALIPRGDSEPLVERALALLEQYNSPLVADICCGSGSYGLAVAALAPAAQVDCCDISAAALELARRNAEQLGVAERVRFFCGDLATPLLQQGRRYHFIMSNPPYIASAQLSELAVQLSFEPVLALDGGADGLHFYRRLAMMLPPLLEHDGLLLLEHGDDQFDAVAAIFSEQGWSIKERLRDYGGRDRGLLCGI